MATQYEINKTQAEIIPKTSSPQPFLQWKCDLNPKTGKPEFKSLELSDGSKIDGDKLDGALKRTVGTTDAAVGKQILGKIAGAMSGDREDLTLNEVSALLPALRPQDETEAMLLGQFLALQDSGMKCLGLANIPEQGFYHQEKLLLLANKLLNTANQTIQTVLKYRCGGQQTMQVIHLHNDGQAIVAQNLSHSSPEEGPDRKNGN